MLKGKKFDAFTLFYGKIGKGKKNSCSLVIFA